VYAWPALLVATLAALGLLLWFRSLPCRQTSEEWLHERLEDEDRRPAHELVA
jgi:hypothetical protein